MQRRIKRILASHDISGVGRCALASIAPILSAMGHQCCPLPTAVLSTHTGGFGDVELCDLTGYMRGAMAQYDRLAIDFDCVYSGFLSSEAQIDVCLDALRRCASGLRVVDPVMGDNGRPYRTYTEPMQRRMIELVRVADLITPNLTEACILLGEPYRFEPMSVGQARKLLVRLAELGPSQVVVTGVQMSPGKLTNIGYDRGHGAFWRVDCEAVPVSYPGTGDIFTAVLTGAMLSGDSLPMAMRRAADFDELAIKTTYGYGADQREGVLFESVLPALWSAGIPEDYHSL